MGLDRNQITGIILLFGLFMAWSWLNSPSPEEIEEQKRIQDSIAQIAELNVMPSASIESAEDQRRELMTTNATVSDSTASAEARLKYGVYAMSAKPSDATYVLENNVMKVTIAAQGGAIVDVELKAYDKVMLDEERNEYKVPLHLLNDEKNRFEYLLPVRDARSGIVTTADLYFDGRLSDDSVELRASASDGSFVVQRYAIQPNSYALDYDIQIEGAGNNEVTLNWVTYLDKLELNDGYEKYYTSVYYKEADDDPDYCNCRRTAKDDLSDARLKWVSHSNQFFNTSLIAKENFGGGVMSTEMLDENSDNLKILRSTISIPVNNQSSRAFQMAFYTGPNEFERLRQFDASLEDIIPFGRGIFGTINRWVIRPIFNYLSRFIGVEGLLILALTLLVKLVLYPLTYRMLYSQAKMSALKPKLAHLKDKFKDDQQGMQMESMKIYREYGVSPLGGCLPMLAQMPIWFALYRFFPASIEFRQASFLWATDLSSYDVFVNLPFEIPFYGAHVSLLTLLWAGTTVLYTYYNTRHMDMASMNPMMKYMQYFMPVMFLFFFNNYASGLTLYLFYSNIINIGLTIGTKKLIFDEDKIRAELEENKKKPKKKGGFQERLEKAMKEQQRITAEKENARKKKAR